MCGIASATLCLAQNFYRCQDSYKTAHDAIYFGAELALIKLSNTAKQKSYADKEWVGRCFIMIWSRCSGLQFSPLSRRETLGGATQQVLNPFSCTQVKMLAIAPTPRPESRSSLDI